MEPKLISGVCITFENSPNPFFLKFSGCRRQCPGEVSKLDFNVSVNTSFYKVFTQSEPKVNLLFILQTVQPSQYVKSGYFFEQDIVGAYILALLLRHT